MNESQSPAPVVLIASGGEWVGRSLENVLESNGYAVLRADSGRSAIELARRTSPDAVLLDDSLPDISAVEVCRALRDDPLFNHATPTFITAAAQHASRVRAAAYAAGAWDYSTLPLDLEMLVVKLATFVRARHEIEVFRSRALFDVLTGLYTEQGLQQWVEQLGARALRKREPIACIVVAPSSAEQRGATAGAVRRNDALSDITELCRSESRRSDILGYLGESRVAILAPDTDQAGARSFIDRLTRVADRTATSVRLDRRNSGIRAGYCAVDDLATAKLPPCDLVRRAATALDCGPLERAVNSFDEVQQR